MKKRTEILSCLLVILGIFLIFTCGCKKDFPAEDNLKKTGVLKFKMLNPFPSFQKGIKSVYVNPPLTGEMTTTYLTSMRACVGDIWVSQSEVIAGAPDTLTWIRLTPVTNRELKLFEEYVIAPKELPVGTYKSIKLTLKNIWYRHTELVSDRSVKYELLETMGGWSDPCDVNDTSWVKTNYFSLAGGYRLNDDEVFEYGGASEKVGFFTVEAGRTAIVNWRLGAGATQPCINYLIDENDNREWDCGTDYILEECPDDYKMFDFLIEYE